MPQPIKQPVNINFQQGLNLKVDPYQVPVGNFLSLVNSVFDKVGRLTKRNGFAGLTELPDNTTTYLTTFNDDLTAIGTSFNVLSTGTNAWINKGHYQPVSLSTLSLVKTAANQVQADCAISSTGLILTAWTETSDGGSSYQYKFQVSDSITGQNIVAPQALIPTSGTVTFSPSTYVLGNYFVIVFEATISGSIHLQYVAMDIASCTVRPAVNITNTGTSGTKCPYQGIVTNNTLYLAWSGNTSSQVTMTRIDANLVISSAVIVDPTHQAVNWIVLYGDTSGSTPVVWVAYDSTGGTGYALVESLNLFQVLAPTQWLSSGTVDGLAMTAMNATATIIYQLQNFYGYDSGIQTDYLNTITVTQTGTVGIPSIIARSVGLASQAVVLNDVSYFLATYSSPVQPTYFLMNGIGQVIAKFAYQNGLGYTQFLMPHLVEMGSLLQAPYFFKDLIQSVNKNTNVPSGTATAAVYSQTGVNLINLDLTSSGLVATEIGTDLHISGGFLWMYDGFLPVEHNFFLYPDSIEASWSTTGGSIAAKPDGSTNTDAYFYQVVYSWTDNQGNQFRSAPSIPIPVTTTGIGTTGSITVDVPTARLTYKLVNKIKIEIYRWSVAQQSYYEVTSVTSPLYNDVTVDFVTFTDTLSDTQILGNQLLYTTGGVLEDVGAPASNILTLFDDRLWLVDAEDPNLLWFSKQVIEGTPVEMSDLLTFFVAPTTGAQGSTGSIAALAPMDDKLIIFKRDAIYYINGIGPDNTGANSQYSQPIFITATVGCSNIRSITMMPNGLMFQSDKGIWLLGRDLSTLYIGAPVEDFNSNKVTSALTIPGTNQVRFGLDNGVTLVYDYFVGQWGQFEGIPSVSATLYKTLHTIVNEFGQVSQETVGTYLDLTRPVLMSFTTSWLNLAGLRGYQRAFWFYFLGTFLSPHKLNVSIAYDYNPSPVQYDLIDPSRNKGVVYGGDQFYGDDGFTTYGGTTPFVTSNIIQQRIFLKRQRCRSFQINIQEVFDYSLTAVPGAGLTLSGLNCIVGIKKTYAPIPSNQQAG